MSSKTGNQEAGQSITEEKAKEQVTDRKSEQPGMDGARVTDQRRFTPDGDPVADSESEEARDGQTDPSEKQAEETSDIDQLQAKFKEAEEKRVEAERQVREFAERFRQAQERLKSETEEQRARMQRNFDQKLEAARGDLIAGLLDTLDNLKRAVAAAEKSEERESGFNALLEGVRATASLFESKMQSLGLTAVASVGEEFNPEFHEAVEIVAVPADQDNFVIEEFQTGYKFGDRLLRPARVRVGRTS
jgi:molecular chaperone GrpE